MIFEYSVKKTFDESIDIVDMGNTALRCTNRFLNDYYMITKTIMGKTHIIRFGPVCPEIDMLVTDFSVSYKKVDYKENILVKEIDKFINDYKKDIDTIEEITEFEAWEEFPEIRQLFENI